MTNETKSRKHRPAKTESDKVIRRPAHDREQEKLNNLERYRSAVESIYRASDRELERAMKELYA